MKLSEARLCCTCDEIFSERSCPKCTSTGWILLSRIIGGNIGTVINIPKSAEVCYDRKG